MAKRILILLLVLIAAAFLYHGYNTYDAKRAGADGAVFEAIAPPSNAATVPSNGPASAVKSDSAQSSTAPAKPINGADASPKPPTAASAPDTISPNPPNGMTFSGTGKYQLYRQGNITWRMDTETGKTCIIFATEEEWKKQRVYRAGCGSTEQ